MVSASIPSVTLSLENGPETASPTNEQIADGLASLTPGGANGGEFAVLGRSDQVYVQAAIAPGSGAAGAAVTFLVEYREGGAALHFQSEQPLSLEQTVTLFQAYAAGGAEWNAGVQWKKI